MTTSFTFHAHVADEAMTKVSRLFNASLDDIFNELLQNARRGGATHVAINQVDDPSQGAVIHFIDNGPGLANPKSLFSLGRSGWEDGVTASEDAAGMGFFALANRGAKIIAQKPGTDQSFAMEARPAAFSGEAPIVVDEGPVGHCGMTIIFPEQGRENVAAAAKHAARYCPLKVSFNGEILESSDFLKEAVHVEDWEGIGIGVFHKPTRIGMFSNHNVNFHGLTLWGPLPDLHQEFHQSFRARIDVTHCAALKLVLPARKEIVQDDFYDRLCMTIRKLFFRMIKDASVHSLSRKDYCLGHALGIKLPEATMLLRPFVPDHADQDQRPYCRPEPVTENAILYDRSEGLAEEQNLARALAQQTDTFPLHEPLAAFNGYAWYDQLACVALKGYRAVCDGQTYDIAPDGRFACQARPDVLEVLLERGDAKQTLDWTLATDAIILSEEYGSLDEADILVTTGSTMTPACLVEFMEAALFSPPDDAEAGSYDQQRQWFTDEAEDIAITMLQSSAAADINLVTRMIRRELSWRLPKDCEIAIRIKGREVEVHGFEEAHFVPTFPPAQTAGE